MGTAKISGLEISQRESYLSLLETVIRKNYDKTSHAEENELSSYDIQQIAIGEEYNIFTSNKVVTMYRRGMAFLMADIKGKTDKYIAHSVLSNYKPAEKPDTPPDPQKKITGFSGFQTALQMSKKSDLPKDSHSLPKKDNESPGDTKIKQKLKLLGLSDDDDQDQVLIREDLSSETSSSPELEMDEPEPET